MDTPQPGWWTTLRPGDPVILDRGGLGVWAAICRVERLTKAQLLVTNPRRGGPPCRFYLKNGYEVGGDVYHSISLVPYTEARGTAIRQGHAREQLLTRLQQLTMKDLAALTIADCDAIHRCLGYYLGTAKEVAP